MDKLLMRAGPQDEPYDNAHEVYRVYTDDGGSYWTFDSGEEMRDFMENQENYVDYYH